MSRIRHRTGQFENTPKAFANFSPGLERERQPWGPKQNEI